MMAKEAETLSAELLQKMNSYWRAANYVSVGQIYLYDNLLLKEPLKLSHVKPLVVGHYAWPKLHICPFEQGYKTV